MRLIAILLASSLAAFATTPAAPTFNKDIAPILYQNCATCHRPGEVAPFSLLSYQDAGKRASLIAMVTQKGLMPPWKPEPGYGSFASERRLSPEQLAMIRDWARAGAPEGDAKDKPTPPVFPEGWQGGQPDKVLSVSQKFEVAADGPDQYRCFVMPLNSDTDIYVSGMEFRPGNRRVVHHALIFLDTSGKARKMAAETGQGSYQCFGGPGFTPAGMLGGWAPGANPAPNSPDLATPVKAGTDVVVQVHYHPDGKPEVDQSELGLLLSGPPSKGRGSIILANRRIDIAPGDSHYEVKGGVTLPRDVDLFGITPHAHYLGKDMKVTATLPDGTVTPLIWIKDWDFNWQGQYRYKEPIHLPKGTRLAFDYFYDNSDSNPHNPTHPAVRVHYGEETQNEMALVFLGVSLPSPKDVQPFHQAMRMEYLEEFFADGNNLSDLPPGVPSGHLQMLKQMVDKFDKNGDGQLDATERAALVQYIRTLPR